MKIDPDMNSNTAIKFDTDSEFCPHCCSVSCIACSTGIGIICLPCIPCYSKAFLKSQKAEITSSSLEFKSGVFEKSEKSIPFSRIQDVTLHQGILQVKFSNI